MIAVIVVTALSLDWLLGEPRRWHPLIGFGACAIRIEAALNSAITTQRTSTTRWRGVLAVVIAIAPATVICMLLTAIPYVGTALQVLVLYLAIGHRSLHDHAMRVFNALSNSNLNQARSAVALMVSRDTASMQSSEVVLATVESVLENGNDAIFGTLFWFVVAGAPGAVLYRLTNTLDAMWGYRTPRYYYFGWAAARLDDLLNWIPARLTALTYAVVGDTTTALRCWQRQAPQWDSPNAGPVMAAGAGCLHLSLGGPAFYHGQWESRPVLGEGNAPSLHDIKRALQLIMSVVIVLVAIIAAGVLWHA